MTLNEAKREISKLRDIYTQVVSGNVCVGDEICFIHENTITIGKEVRVTGYAVVQAVVVRDDYKKRHEFMMAVDHNRFEKFLAPSVYRSGTYAKPRGAEDRKLFLAEKYERARMQKGA